MSEQTGISWTDHTFNPWSGCAKVSAGCTHCYAADLPPAMRRFAEWGANGTRIPASESYWREPMKWARKAAAAGERRRVFCASVADVFEDRDDLDEQRERLWKLIHATPDLDWLLLTKRPEKMAAWAERHDWPVNAWAGVSVENQSAAADRIPHLLRVPARVRFLSCEPLLGPVDLQCVPFRGGALNSRDGGALYIGEDGGPEYAWSRRNMLHWVIVGGESGRHARPMHPDWARGLRDQCQRAGVAFHFKQFGEWAPVGSAGNWHSAQDVPGVFHTWVRPDGIIGQGVDQHRMAKVGKHAAGRTLDGRVWDEFPTVDR